MIKIICLKTMTEAEAPPFSVLCLGNFDGVHIGHRALIKQTVKNAERLAASFPGTASGAWLFAAPPSLALMKKTSPQLTSLADKLARFASLGLEYAFLADFSELKDMEPHRFVNEVLNGECHCIYTVCGFDFRFAKNASGDASMLLSLMNGRGEIVDCVTLDGEAVSSSSVRGLLSEGNVEKAARMLGDPFAHTACVIHGRARGKDLGIPTINQQFPEGTARPADGVYVSQTQIDGIPFPSVSNVGTRPTFEKNETVNCETHILGYEGDLYGRTVRVEFLKRLRDEMKFSSAEELKKQMATDIRKTIEYFEHTRRQI